MLIPFFDERTYCFDGWDSEPRGSMLHFRSSLLHLKGSSLYLRGSMLYLYRFKFTPLRFNVAPKKFKFTPPRFNVAPKRFKFAPPRFIVVPLSYYFEPFFIEIFLNFNYLIFLEKRHMKTAVIYFNPSTVTFTMPQYKPTSKTTF